MSYWPHSNPESPSERRPHPVEGEDYRRCIRGCTKARAHLKACENREKCRGCLPREAKHGDLCWPCHRRLELTLTDMPTVADWVQTHLPRGTSRRMKDDYRKPVKADAPPIPIDLDVLDLGETIYASIKGWVEALVEGTSLVGPEDDTLQALCSYLLTHLTAVENAPFIEAMWDELAWISTDAHALAPWRPEVRRLEGIPCPHCHVAALVIYGGDVDATCQECREMIPENIYPLWTKVAAQRAIG